jgi:hypothetical protein
MVINFPSTHNKDTQKEIDTLDNEFIEAVGGEALCDEMKELLKLSHKIGISSDQITVRDVAPGESLVHQLSPNQRRELIKNLN